MNIMYINIYLATLGSFSSLAHMHFLFKAIYKRGREKTNT